jgi:hypothetical protein
VGVIFEAQHGATRCNDLRYANRVVVAVFPEPIEDTVIFDVGSEELVDLGDRCLGSREILERRRIIGSVT